MKPIYLDHAATTPVRPEVLAAMLPYFSERFGNPGGVHQYAREAQSAMDLARATVAGALGVSAGEIYFTAGGTESNSLAIRGIAKAHGHEGKHIITTSIEHHAVLRTCEALEQEGYTVTYLPVDEKGFVTAQQVMDAVQEDTILVSVMFANNEIGTIEPIAEIGTFCREKNIPFHTDAVQAFGVVPVNAVEASIDLLSLSAHKIYGPKGVGALYLRKGIAWTSFTTGGNQEQGRRAGTENIPGIVGLGKATELAVRDLDHNAALMVLLRERLKYGILEQCEGVRINGPEEDNRLPNHLSVCFEAVRGEVLLLLLDQNGISASRGSACTSGSVAPSHVLSAIGVPPELSQGALRLTLGIKTTEEEIDRVLEVLSPLVNRLRMVSPCT